MTKQTLIIAPPEGGDDSAFFAGLVGAQPKPAVATPKKGKGYRSVPGAPHIGRKGMRGGSRPRLKAVEPAEKHYGPGAHPGTGTSQEVHGGGMVPQDVHGHQLHINTTGRVKPEAIDRFYSALRMIPHWTTSRIKLWTIYNRQGQRSRGMVTMGTHSKFIDGSEMIEIFDINRVSKDDLIAFLGHEVGHSIIDMVEDAASMNNSLSDKLAEAFEDIYVKSDEPGPTPYARIMRHNSAEVFAEWTALRMAWTGTDDEFVARYPYAPMASRAICDILRLMPIILSGDDIDGG